MSLKRTLVDKKTELLIFYNGMQDSIHRRMTEKVKSQEKFNRGDNIQTWNNAMRILDKSMRPHKGRYYFAMELWH